MNDRRQNEELVLAVFPSARGFGFAIFEGPRSLVDWGVRGVRGERKNVQSLVKVQELLTFYRPDVLVTEDCEGPGSRRAKQDNLVGAITDVCNKRGTVTRSFSRAEVRAFFRNDGARAKGEIARSIAREFPELEPRLPPVRRIWTSEDARMNIFDAVALGMTFFHTKKQINRAT